jgi:Protein of unknown function (DUF4019)
MKTAQSLSVLVLSVCLSALCAHAEDRPEPRAQMAAEAWLGHVDVGDYATSWQEASAYFQGAVTEHEWTASLNGVRKPLGHVVSRKLQSVQHTTSVPGAPDGNYVVMQFATRFENKQAATETVTVLQEQDGTWEAAGYYIK